MVGTDHPQRILSLEPGMAGEDILQRVVECMADMKRAGDVWRRIDDRPRFRIRPLRPKEPPLLPMLVPASLDLRGLERLRQFGHAQAISGRAAEWKPLGSVGSLAPVPAPSDVDFLPRDSVLDE
jgi:hypothetical protein